ncbi:MAG: hypothetical protein WD231_05000 [Candidatus Woykebacteria bacterium]
MDLFEKVQTALKEPFSIPSFYTLFVTLFILLMLPLTVLGIYAQRGFLAQAKENCASPAERTFTGSLNPNKDSEHTFVFDGGNCRLTAWVNGEGDADVSLWIYEPDGNIRVVDEHKDKSYEFVSVASPAKKGQYRIAVRQKAATVSSYSVTVSFR